MENLTDNAQLGANAELEAAKAMYAEWKKNKETTTKTKPVTREDALKKHFVPREEKETFRPIHPNINEQYVKHAFFHEVYLNKAGGKKQKRKIYCPAHNDPQVQATNDQGQPVFDEQGRPVMVNKPCPLCAKAKAVLPSNVKLTGRIHPEEESSKFAFDTGSREIVWMIGDIEPGSQQSIAVQIALTPDSSQKGITALLVKQVDISGEDQWTETIISGTDSSIRTDRIVK